MQIVNVSNYNNKSYNNRIVVKRASNNIGENSNEIAFKGFKRKTLIGVAYSIAVIVVGIMMPSTTVLNMLPSKKIVDNINEGQISKNSGWGENIRVLASNGQNHTSETGCNGITNKISSSYSTNLISTLKKKGINTIEEANEVLSKGYTVINKTDNIYYALETSGNKLNIFNKLNKNKERFVLVFSEAGDKDSPVFNNLKNDFKNDIKEIYNISDANIIKISVEEKSEFINGIKEIKNKIKNAKNKENVELLVAFFGHGAAVAKKTGSGKVEGEMEGFILDDLNEQDAKQIFKESFENIKTLFVVQSCHSGALISKNTKNAVKNLNRLV